MLLDLIKRIFPRLERAELETRPLICLIREEAAPQLLPRLSELLEPGSSGLVVSAELGGGPVDEPAEANRLPPTDPADVEKVKALLTRLAVELGTVGSGRRIRRFRRFALTAWLMEQTLSPQAIDQGDRAREMRKALRGRARFLERASDIPNDSAVPGWLRVVALVAPSVWFRARVSGRVPLVSGHYRWFVRPESLAPPIPGEAADVATGLTRGEWERDPESTLLSLVNSFMEDIRVAYRRRLRTSCCTMLMSNITRGNGGYHLLRAINDVRNKTRLADPLLVITESHRVPPFAVPPSGIELVSEAGAAHENWLTQVSENRRRSEPEMWYLPLKVPAAEDFPRNSSVIRASAPPRYRLVARACLVVLPLFLVAAGYFYWSKAHCGSGLSWPGLKPTLETEGEECIGVTDDLTRVFQPLDKPSVQVAQRIKDQNADAETEHEQQPGRPYVTIISVGMLSAPTSEANSQATEREELEGVAVAQAQQLRANGDADPLIRVLVANGGRKMAHGAEVADIIASLAHDDKSIVGVVGFSASYQSTMDSIDVLANAGIPVVATLSPDSFADKMLMYYQIPPQNRRQAEVVAAYADQLRRAGAVHTNAARTYYSADEADFQ